MRQWLLFLLLLGFIIPSEAQTYAPPKTGDTTVIQRLFDEQWYNGIVLHGAQMPLKNGYDADLRISNYSNQCQPLLLSNKGRYIWTEDAARVKFDGEQLIIVCSHPIQVVQAGKTLKEAYLAAGNKHFPPSGKMPDSLLFAVPQFNSWIEINLNDNQQKVLNYASNIISNGFEPGVFMIDGGWQIAQGNWDFCANRYPDPKAMLDSLHKMGFKVMLWTSPFVSPDSRTMKSLLKQGFLLMPSKGNYPALLKWWSSQQSAAYDLSNPSAMVAYKASLKRLQDLYGVDGFKFDAGDHRFYVGDIVPYDKNTQPQDQSTLYAQVGLDFPFNEYRACWKMGNQPLMQRLQDKKFNWEDLKALIPDVTLQGILGYAFTCPDMVGGGELNSFLSLDKVDQELFVRSAQTAALMPMIQFSVAPWRVLDKEHMDAVFQAVATRQKLVPYILQLAENAAKTGEPIVRMMEYEYPNKGYADVTDQFMLGSKYLVAPVQEKGAVSRTVLLPAGKWKSWQGQILRGGKAYTFDVTLNDLPYFEKI